MQGGGELGTQQSHSPDASPPTPERRWPGKPRRETATSDVCTDFSTMEQRPAHTGGSPPDGHQETEPYRNASQPSDSPAGSCGSEVARDAEQPLLSTSVIAEAPQQPAGQRGGSEASQQLQALAHHLMDEVSQVLQTASDTHNLCCAMSKQRTKAVYRAACRYQGSAGAIYALLNLTLPKQVFSGRAGSRRFVLKLSLLRPEPDVNRSCAWS